MTENTKINVKPLNQMTNDELRDNIPPMVAIRELLRHDEGDSIADDWYEQNCD